jgi:hypothetical protein
VELAERFLFAFDGFDAETAISYLANDDVLDDLVTIEDRQGTGALARYLSMLEAIGFDLIVGRCDATASGDDTFVTCPYDFHALRSDEIGLGPYTGSTFTFTVRDGAIVRADTGLNFLDAFSPQMWEPFAAWVSETYPEDASVMYTDAGLTDYALTEEAIRLWEKRTREYVGVALSDPVPVAQRFMEARSMHDIEGAMSLLDDGGASVRMLEDNEPSTSLSMGTRRMGRQQLSLALATERVFGVAYGSVACGPIVHDVYPPAAEANVECSFLLDSRLRRLERMSPEETFGHLGVHDGSVTFLSFPYLNASFPGNVPSEAWPFIEWLQEEHPDVGGPMRDGIIFHTRGQELTLNLTPDAIDLLERYLDEYDRSVTG